MLADPAYCDLVQNIGVASLTADEKQIWHLTKLYWFTVEFGVVREGDQIKGFGAGVLSSYGELQHMASGTLLEVVKLLSLHAGQCSRMGRPTFVPHSLHFIQPFWEKLKSLLYR